MRCSLVLGVERARMPLIHGPDLFFPCGLVQAMEHVPIFSPDSAAYDNSDELNAMLFHNPSTCPYAQKLAGA